MATDEQGQSVKAAAEALRALNLALDKASDAGVFVELQTMSEIGSRNRKYLIAVSETRETVLPK